MADPQALFDDISRFVAESRQLLEQGALMEMAGLDQRVKQLCETVLQLSQQERLTYAENLQQLLGDLNTLGEMMVAQRDQVAAEIRQLNQHKKANAAYRIVEASDGYTADES